jgi:hypothetical protein
MKRTSIDPNVPISKPLPNKETYKDEEKNDEIKNTTGIAKATNRILSFGTTNLPSPSLEISQKKTDSVAPTDNKNPLLASSVTGVYGMKKKRLTNKVNKRVTNDNLLKNSTFFDSIFFIL